MNTLLILLENLFSQVEDAKKKIAELKETMTTYSDWKFSITNNYHNMQKIQVVPYPILILEYLSFSCSLNSFNLSNISVRIAPIHCSHDVSVISNKPLLLTRLYKRKWTLDTKSGRLYKLSLALYRLGKIPNLVR